MGNKPKQPWYKRVWSYVLILGGIGSVLGLIDLLKNWGILYNLGKFATDTAQLILSDWISACLRLVLAVALCLLVFVLARHRGYLKGFDIGKGQGRSEAIPEVEAKAREEGRQAGVDEERTATRMYRPLIEALAQTIPTETTDASKGGGMLEASQRLVYEYAELVRQWGVLLSTPISTGAANRQSVLAVHTLTQYLNTLHTLKQSPTQRLVLPGIFEQYAECVWALLDMIAGTHPTAGKTVTIWTHFSRPISRWYNLSEAPDGDGRLWNHSHDWWEKYKNRVAGLTRMSGPDANTHIQMRRVVTRCVGALDESNLLVYQPEHGHPLTIRAATAKKATLLPPTEVCPTLLATIDAALRKRPRTESELPIHLIAECKCRESKVRESSNNTFQFTHPGWSPLRDHFDSTYHNDVIHSSSSSSPDDKGVYCAHNPDLYSAERLRYEDVFLVDMRAAEAGVFGIAYYVDPITKVSGIVFLTPEETEAEIVELQAVWSKAAQRKTEVA